MSQFTILLSAPYMLPYSARFIPILNELDMEVIIPEVHERLEEEEILAYAGKFDGTICGDDRYSSDVIEKCAPRLKVISKWGTGIDSIDKEFAATLDIPVFRTTNAFTVPVSDSVMAYILAFARMQPWMDRNIKNGGWEKIPGKSLTECTLGVIGVGNIGKAVLQKAHAFNMKLIATDIVKIPEEFIKKYDVEMMELADLVSRADFISVSCDLNPTSLHLINAEVFANMKPTSVIINTARGSIIDQKALIDVLSEKRIAGAALDVFEVEPIPGDSPLLSMENVMLAPHNSNSSPLAWEAVHWNSIRNLLVGLNIPLDKYDAIKNVNMENIK